MKKLYFLTIMFLLFFPCTAFALKISDEVSRSEFFEYKELEELSCSNENNVETPDGGRVIMCHFYDEFIIKEITISPKGSADWFIVKYDKNGQIEWWKQYGGSDQEDLINYYIYDNIDGIMMIGETPSQDIEDLPLIGKRNIVMVKFSYTGEMLWQKVYGGNKFETIDYAYQTKDNNYIISGATSSTNADWFENSNNLRKGFIIKVNNDGELIWKNDIEEKIDSIKKILENDSGNYMIIGTYVESILPENYVYQPSASFIIEYAKTGEIVWEDNYKTNYRDDFIEIKQIKDGYIIVSNTMIEDDTDDRTKNIIKYSKNGTIVYENGFKWDGISSSSEIFECDLEGNCYLVYLLGDIIENTDLSIVRINSNGIGWQKEYGGSKEESIKKAYITQSKLVVSLTTESTDIEGLVLQKERENVLVEYDFSGNFISQKIFTDENVIIPTFDDGFLIIKNLIDSNEDAKTEEEYVNSLKVDFVIEKYNYLEEKEWEYKYEEPTLDFILDVEEISDKKYILKGLTIVDALQYEYKELHIVLTLSYEIKKESTPVNGTYDVKQEGNKGIITLSPKFGYELDNIIVTNSKGDVIEVRQENGQYYFELTDDVNVNVTYKSVISNPETGVYISISMMLLIAISAIVIYNFTNKYKPISRI